MGRAWRRYGEPRPHRRVPWRAATANNTVLMNNSAVEAALEALDRTLGEALKLVTDCQQDTNFVLLCCKAGNLSKQLIKMEQRISSANMDAMLSIVGFLLPQGFNQDGSHPQSSSQQVYSSGRQDPSQFQAMQPPSPPKQMWRQNQDGGNVNVQTDNNLGYFVGRPKERLTWNEMGRQNQDGDVTVQTHDHSYASIFEKVRAERLARTEVNTPVPEVDPVMSNSQWDSSMDTLCSCCAMVEKRKPVRRPSLTPDGEPLSLLDQIEAVALDIKEASETVLQHRENCIEIDKRVSRVSALLSQLKNTEMVEKQAMKDELNKLLETFRRGHTLIMICQRSGIVTTFVCSPPCTLLKQLSALLDQLVPHVNAIIAVIVNSTLGPQRDRSILRGNVGGY